MTGYTGARGNGIFDDLRFSSEIVHLGLPLTIYDALISTLTEQVDSEIVPSAVNLFKRKLAGQSFLAVTNSPREGGLYPLRSEVALAKEDSKQDDNGNWNS